jgi:hypothetical protein
MRIEDWLHAASADADRRNLPELKPLLEALARSTTNLRRADSDLAAAADVETPPDTAR